MPSPFAPMTAAIDPSTSGGLVGLVLTVMQFLGAPGAGLLVALENLFPPIPSELILPLAGFTARLGGMSLLAAVAWTTAGSVLGALVLYAAGARLGRDRVRSLWVRLPLTELSDMDRAEAWFDEHGRSAVLLGRLIPMVRSLISVPAGTNGMPLPRFVVLTALGSGAWNTALIMAGYLLGSQWERVEGYVGILQYVVFAVLAALLVRFVVRRLRRRRERAGSPRGA